MTLAPAAQEAAIMDPDIVAQLSADSSSLLDTIDALRELGVSNFVDLPQIIVVGDQSSGKSSVLEAISRVRFPVDGDICTRFATELVLRPAPGGGTWSIVSIQFANHEGNPARPPFRRTAFDREMLPYLIQEAKEAMGIRSGGGKQFSKDILRIEVNDPDVPPVTLVDLPGIFHSATADQGGKGRAIVNQLIDSYMKQSKSIILAVVSAGQPLAGQAVLDKAVEHDPKRERTIGVITKPDLAGRQNGRKYLDLAKGREPMHRLSLGWYVLRNRSEEERLSSAAAERDAAEEAFFRSSTDWSSINPANRGVESLRKRLSKVLLDHIRSSLPELIVNIDRNVGERKRELGRLGAPRSTPEALRSYLGGIAGDFHRLANDAVEGRYRDEFFGELNETETRVRKLRAVLGNMHLAFEVVMETNGACYEIESSDGRDGEGGAGSDGEDEGTSFDNERSPNHPDHIQELVDGYNVEKPEVKSVKDLGRELEVAFNRGKEFPGDVNPDLGFLLLKKQTTPWKAIAQQHLDSVLAAAKRFVEQLFIHIMGLDEDTLAAVLATYVDPFFDEKKNELEAKLAELLSPYVNGCALPRQREARKRLRKVTFEQLEAHLRQNHEDSFRVASLGAHYRVTLGQVVNAVHDLSRTRERRSTPGIEGVVEKVTVQYEVRIIPGVQCSSKPAAACSACLLTRRTQMFRETFIENVINLAVESCLVYHIPDILTTGKVDRMTAAELKDLASESVDIQIRRKELEAEVKILEEGLRKCQRHKPRPLAGKQTPTPFQPSSTAEPLDPNPTTTFNTPPPPTRRRLNPILNAHQRSSPARPNPKQFNFQTP